MCHGAARRPGRPQTRALHALASALPAPAATWGPPGPPLGGEAIGRHHQQYGGPLSPPRSRHTHTATPLHPLPGGLAHQLPPDRALPRQPLCVEIQRPPLPTPVLTSTFPGSWPQPRPSPRVRAPSFSGTAPDVTERQPPEEVTLPFLNHLGEKRGEGWTCRVPPSWSLRGAYYHVT